MTTLGMMFALRGLVYVWTNKTPVVDENGFTAFTALYQGERARRADPRAASPSS